MCIHNTHQKLFSHVCLLCVSIVNSIYQIPFYGAITSDFIYIAFYACILIQTSVLCTRAACEDGDLRLVNGSTAREGRVEVCYGNVYGTVCDDQWGLLDATVACRDLRFSDAGNDTHRLTFTIKQSQSPNLAYK